VETFADHRHCKVCGKACGSKDSFCSSACEKKRAETIRSRRTLQTIMYATIAVLVLGLLLQFHL
jgi:predicted nucleic acid-binding Zn ribbon protein